MDRPTALSRLTSNELFDIAVIGGGATGIGIAVDSASRGHSVALLERGDFGHGTSSRSTKLVHGGVRYLQQMDLPLVIGALRERGILRRNAPHLVHALPFVIPAYRWWERPYYAAGLTLYDLLAGAQSFGRSRLLSRRETIACLPGVERSGLCGGVLYYDGQFDDARLLITLAQTAADHGAALLNYAEVSELHKNPNGHIDYLTFTDGPTGQSHRLRAKVIINATGAFADSIRQMDDPAAPNMIAPSQGAHIVLDGSFLNSAPQSSAALMVPRTPDGRVMFAIPWHGHLLIGTTDTAIAEPSAEPIPLDKEIDFLLETAGQYLARQPTRADILSTFAGIRPLIRPRNNTARTASISRDHTISVSASGLLTLAGGKWTTYRKMAEDAVDQAAKLADLRPRPCITAKLGLHGRAADDDPLGPPVSTQAEGDALSVYGADASQIRSIIEENPDLGRALHPDLPILAAQIIWAARHEMAMTLEDVLARRTRALFLDARAAMQIAPRAAELMAGELGRDTVWQT